MTAYEVKRMCVLLCEKLKINHEFDDLATHEWYEQFICRHPFLYCGMHNSICYICFGMYSTFFHINRNFVGNSFARSDFRMFELRSLNFEMKNI